MRRPIPASVCSVCWAGALWVVVGCGGAPEAATVGHREPSRAATPGGVDVVAQVGPRVVTARDVRDLMAATGLDPREALERLVVEQLLTEEAERRGYGRSAAVSRAERRAGAHALLAKAVEAEVTAESLSASLLQERLAKEVTRRTRPERRRADHILFRLRPKESDATLAVAREGAQQALDALGRAEDVDAVLDRYAQLGSYQERVPIEVERLPPAPRRGRLEKPFAEALFEASGPGVVPQVVRTKYGLHVIVLREILPERAPEPASLEARVRATLLVEQRRERLNALLERARVEVPVEYQPAVVSAALAGEGVVAP